MTRTQHQHEALYGAIDTALAESRRAGASAAEASANEGRGLSATVRLGEVETVEHHQGRRLNVTVYLGGRKGSASTSDFGSEAIELVCRAACDIARHSSSDDFAGLADPKHLAREIPDLDLLHPWALDTSEAVALAQTAERVARDFDARIRNSEGASVNTYSGCRAYGNSLGFLSGWCSSRHSLDCVVIAGQGDTMQRDFWYSARRDACELETPEHVGAMAARRAVARLGARRIPTCSVPVVFEQRMAAGLFSQFVAAISGGNLYRRSSFLLDCLDTAVFPDHLDISEQPHLPKALGSAPFDADGVATAPRNIVTGGVLRGYLLSVYAARKLGMAPTGNAGGAHNLVVTPGDRDLPGLLALMGRGLLVTELMGFGVNITTGDYSRGASGFWVEDGAIRHPVEEVTIAGNLKDMFAQVVATGSDVETRGNIRVGSTLIAQMTVAGG